MSYQKSGILPFCNFLWFYRILLLFWQYFWYFRDIRITFFICFVSSLLWHPFLKNEFWLQDSFASRGSRLHNNRCKSAHLRWYLDHTAPLRHQSWLVVRVVVVNHKPLTWRAQNRVIMVGPLPVMLKVCGGTAWGRLSSLAKATQQGPFTSNSSKW